MYEIDEIGWNPVSKRQIQPEYGDGVGRRGTGRPNPYFEIKFSGADGDRGNINLPCSADHEQDCQPYSVDLNSCYCISDDHTYILSLAFGMFLLVFLFPGGVLPFNILRYISPGMHLLQTIAVSASRE